MRGLLKFILIVVVLLMSGFIITIGKEATGRGNSSGGGPFGFIVSIAALAAIRAIWKYNPTEEGTASENKDIHKLDKN